MSIPVEIITPPSLADSGFYWREKSGVRVLVCRALEEKGFANGFSTRLGGVSAMPESDLNLSGFDDDSEENIFENRRRFLEVFDGNFTLSTVWQIHSDKIKVVHNLDSTKETNEKYDALISNISGVLAGVKTADCVPVLIGDEKTRAFAAIHAGWRGTAASIVTKTIDLLCVEFRTEARNLTAAIGPAAVCNYEVGSDVINAFGQNFPLLHERLFTPTREGHATVDLHRANREQLISAGVPSKNIFTVPFCTLEQTDLFFSYRKEKKLYGKTGRMLSVIGRVSAGSRD
jgi:polyphenol oxidase